MVQFFLCHSSTNRHICNDLIKLIFMPEIKEIPVNKMNQFSRN